MKKWVISLALILIMLTVVGCLDYKAYDVPKKENSAGEADQQLLDEIAQIEEELGTTDNEELEGEIVLPPLDEEETEPETDATGISADYTVTVKENEKVSLNIKSNDPDSDNITYTFTPPLDAAGQWKTNYGDAGEYLVTLKASDSVLTTEKTIKIVVQRVNVPPVIKPLNDLSTKEGETITLEPEVSDPNKDPVSITISEPLKNGVFITDHESAGEYQITVTATDGELESKQTFNLMIKDVNVLPEISGLIDLTVKEGETITVKPEITDLDGDEIVLTISEPVGDDGIWETDYTNHGAYNIVVTADDGKDKVTQNFKVIVEDVNMPPEIIDISISN